MKHTIQGKWEDGFSLVEMMVSMLILIPIMGAAVSLFSVGVRQQASEQGSIDANQEVRSGFELMTLEIAQAGSHGDRNTTLNGNINTAGANDVTVASTAGFTAGDFVDVDTGAKHEIVNLTAVTATSISGVFMTTHVSSAPVRLFALPYTTGMIPPAGLAASSSASVTTLRFFGDITGDSNVSYVEYNYDSNNNQITRSITPITQATKNAALPIVRNLKPNAVQFTLNTDSQGVVTSVGIVMTVKNTLKTGTQYEETELSTKVVIPSAAAASTLRYEILRYGGIDRLPSTPSRVTTWTSQ